MPASKRLGRPVLSVRDLRLRADARPIEFELKAGELIGLAGLEGQGGNAFLEALRGGTAYGGEVIRHLPDGDVTVRAPAPTRPIAASPTSRASGASIRCSAG